MNTNQLYATAHTPAGAKLLVPARDDAHKARIERRNPKPAAPPRIVPTHTGPIPSAVWIAAKEVGRKAGLTQLQAASLLDDGDMAAIAAGDSGLSAAWEGMAGLAAKAMGRPA